MSDVPYKTHVETQAPLYNLELGWLLEVVQDLVPSPPNPIYLCIASGLLAWTVSHKDALRFSRKEDAVSFWNYASRDREMRGNTVNAVCHGWHMDPK